jgi:hypothetical protein
MSNGPPFANANLRFAIAPLEGVVPSVTLSSNFNQALGYQHLTHEIKPITIENLRGKEDSVDLDSAGFQVVQWPTEQQAFARDSEIERDYYPECVELLKEITGASRIFITGHCMCQSGAFSFPYTHLGLANVFLAVIRRRCLDGSQAAVQLSSSTHVDNTLESTIQNMNRVVPAAEVSSLLQRRFQVINVWRPISHPAFDFPLTVCDYRSVNPKEDTFVIHFDYAAGGREMLAVKYNENQRWKYVYGLRPDEVILIKW